MGLKKEFNLLDVFCISSGAMISSGLFILPGLVYAKIGPAVILAYILAGLFILPALFAKAELTTAMPRAGGSYFFVERSMGSLAGTIGGFASWFSLSLKSAFALVGIGIFATLLNSNITEWQIKLIAAGLCVVFTNSRLFLCFSLLFYCHSIYYVDSFQLMSTGIRLSCLMEGMNCLLRLGWYLYHLAD